MKPYVVMPRELDFVSVAAAPPAFAPGALDAGVLGAVGHTPLVPLLRAGGGRLRVFAKLEGHNPGGSAKDRPALEILRHAVETGAVRPGTVVVESSSGNMGIGLAQVCRYLELRFICIVDARATEQHVRILRAYGAEVDVVERPDPATGEFLPARLARVRELLARRLEVLVLRMPARGQLETRVWNGAAFAPGATGNVVFEDLEVVSGQPRHEIPLGVLHRDVDVDGVDADTASGHAEGVSAREVDRVGPALRRRPLPGRLPPPSRRRDGNGVDDSRGVVRHRPHCADACHRAGSDGMRGGAVIRRGEQRLALERALVHHASLRRRRARRAKSSADRSGRRSFASAGGGARKKGEQV